MTNVFKRIRIFGHETVLELKKAVWPNWAELKESTVVVLIGALLLAAAIFVADWSIFNWVTVLSRLVYPEFTA